MEKAPPTSNNSQHYNIRNSGIPHSDRGRGVEFRLMTGVKGSSSAYLSRVWGASSA